VLAQKTRADAGRAAARGARQAEWLYASKDYTGKRFVICARSRPPTRPARAALYILRSTAAPYPRTEMLVYKGVMYLTIDKSLVCDRVQRRAASAGTTMDRQGAVRSPPNRGWREGRRVVRETADGYLIAVDLAKARCVEPADRDASTSQDLRCSL